jgi:hypothetical protein
MKLTNFYYISALVALGRSSPARFVSENLLIIPGLLTWTVSSIFFDMIITEVSISASLARVFIEILISYLVLLKVFQENNKKERIVPAYITIIGANSVAWSLGLLIFFMTDSVNASFSLTAALLASVYLNVFRFTLELDFKKSILPTFFMVLAINIPGMVLHPYIN